jgi:salicylate hydroxylase
MSASKPRIAIVGAGIGGLTLGLLLRKHGVHARIYEQATELREVGAAVALAANGTKVLRELGLGHQLKEFSVEPTDVVYRHGESGKLIVSFPMGAAYTERYGAEFFGIHRMNLQRILGDSWGDDGLYLNSRVQHLEEDEDGIHLHFASGGSATADVVIGADGVHSVVRNWVTGGGPPPTYSDTSGFRGIVPISALSKMPDPMTIQFWLGAGAHVLHYPISSDLINFLAVVPGPIPWQSSTWMTEEPPGTLLKAFQDWHPAVREMVDAVEQSPRWALFSLPPLQSWSRGHTVLLGDAAHAMLPHQGQGANQTIEDAAVLATLLAASGQATLSNALNRYEVSRRARTRQVQRASWVNSEILHHPDGPDAESRDQKLSTLPEYLEWIHGYEVSDLVTGGVPQPIPPPTGRGTSLSKGSAVVSS